MSLFTLFLVAACAVAWLATGFEVPWVTVIAALLLIGVIVGFVVWASRQHSVAPTFGPAHDDPPPYFDPAEEE